MQIYNLYSKRNSSLNSDVIYDSISEKLKIQIIHIWNSFFSDKPKELQEECWDEINTGLCIEHGKDDLFPNDFFSTYSDKSKVEHYFKSLSDVQLCLDVIEMVYIYIDACEKSIPHNHFYKVQITFDQAVKHLNIRFKENNVGYEYSNKTILRVDNSVLHEDVIQKTLLFLKQEEFSNANEEYVNGLRHYRQSNYKECLNECLKALESTLKIICAINNWEVLETDTAHKLIKKVIDNGLIPSHLQTFLTGIRTTLESGVPTFRNKMGGHGQGVDKIIVPQHFASYVLYITGSSISFLVDCNNEMKGLQI